MFMNTSSQGEISSHCAASLYETKSLNIKLLHFFIERRKLRCDQEYSDTTDQVEVLANRGHTGEVKSPAGLGGYGDYTERMFFNVI